MNNFTFMDNVASNGAIKEVIKTINCVPRFNMACDYLIKRRKKFDVKRFCTECLGRPGPALVYNKFGMQEAVALKIRLEDDKDYLRRVIM